MRRYGDDYYDPTPASSASDAISARRGISLSSASSRRGLPATRVAAADPHRSMSGNPLHTVVVAEESELELDREEMRRLVAGVKEGEAAFDGEQIRMFHDGSTLGTTASAMRAMGESEHGAGGSVNRPRVEIDGAPGEPFFCLG